jgi:ribonuclease HI
VSRKAVLFADGGARGNPGPAALGAVLVGERGEVLREIGEFLGTATNNVAEWRGLIAGLEAALEEGVDDLDVRLDSELVVRQVTGVYRVKHPGLIDLFNRARTLMRRFARVDVQHVRRKENAAADRLVNLVLDDVARAKRENDVAASN